MTSVSNKEDDGFDPKYSLVYMNSTAALMETLFKNMKDEDFVYPSKKTVGADEGRIIRCEELMSRKQKASAEQSTFILGDPYLESMLAKMSDEDFTYETKKPVDPNYGRVVRALELMELAGCSTDDVHVKINIETAETIEPPQKENVASGDSQQDRGSNSSQPDERDSGSDNGDRNKKFASQKKQNNKGRVKYNIQSWKNDHRSSGNDKNYVPRRQSTDSYRPLNQKVANGNENGTHSYENRTFSPQNEMFRDYGNNGGSRYPKNPGYSNNGRGRGNRRGGYGEYNSNNGQQRTTDVDRDQGWNTSQRSNWNGNQGANTAQKFWTGVYNEEQMWK
ncbi:hypothetical protein GCK72_023391 [Caenorhabditis remanei]|uniref:Uncharacterized protein n=1 Tax=Caenorhabditis remanei TaxID=31234 RepID=A0A6A5FWJ4_CAERE|nr:hypothetical protein GCK72_023391 [Caenorhabditis remanei]KAF1746933.1 hypothetical protein GCK72_023391 [Caenorhabditis remanei]